MEFLKDKKEGILGYENALEPFVLLLGSKMGNHLLRKMMGDFFL